MSGKAKKKSGIDQIKSNKYKPHVEKTSAKRPKEEWVKVDNIREVRAEECKLGGEGEREFWFWFLIFLLFFFLFIAILAW